MAKNQLRQTHHPARISTREQICFLTALLANPHETANLDVATMTRRNYCDRAKTGDLQQPEEGNVR
jgi:hypothetical protein